jgi:hypothetical protein
LKIFLILNFLVLEIKTEKIKPTMEGSTFEGSKEFRFNIPASSDYFTRFSVCYFVTKIVFYNEIVFLAFQLIFKW